ncbi:hypothetical protein CYMTET_34270 [Cymbomonas tetramitiformis]|uniref:Uncharacterized protein n=1 Tax=Cymbomonas tetramitiformis TaxID=36881 RepID=A0AAE0FBG5_9CHLO|nr:hypothetical protein CYMTET_34270 [Cymbomonas tetramitiformis]
MVINRRLSPLYLRQQNSEQDISSVEQPLKAQGSPRDSAEITSPSAPPIMADLRENDSELELPNVPLTSQVPASPTKENAILTGRPEGSQGRKSLKGGQHAPGKAEADGNKTPLERMAVALQKAQGDDKMSIPTAGLRETYPFNVSRSCPGTMDSQIMRAEKSRRLFASTLVLLTLTVLWNFLNPTRVVEGSFTLDPNQPISLDIDIGSVLTTSGNMELREVVITKYSIVKFLVPAAPTSSEPHSRSLGLSRFPISRRKRDDHMLIVELRPRGAHR